jgi:Kef-type K+ transport system membrane component KefB
VGRLVRRFVPEIVVFLALGIAVGPQGLGLINGGNLRSLELLTVVALGMIIFLLGDRLRFVSLRPRLSVLLPLNLVQVIITGAVVFAATRAVGADTRLAFVLAVIAAETGVLTVTATVREERAAGRFTEDVLASVGLTNVLVAGLFGITFPFVLAASPDVSGPLAILTAFSQIVVASALIGLVGGWLFTRLGAVFETSGELLLFLIIVITGIVATDLAVKGSVVVSTLIAGVFVANRAPWVADRLFASVRTLEAPIYLVFFVVAGAGIHIDELGAVGALGAAYVLARVVGKVAGTVVAARGAAPRLDTATSFRLGLGLLPHAGMAIALVAFVVEQAPLLADDVSGVVLGSIMLFELGGPVLLRRVLRSSGDAGRSAAEADAAPTQSAAGRRFATVVIPIGSGRVALPRLPFLFDLVDGMGAELVLVHVSQPGKGANVGEEPPLLRQVRELAEARQLRCRTRHQISERVATAIADVVNEEQADLLVMGEPLRASLFDATGWSPTTRRVSRLIDIPMLVYPVDPHEPEQVTGRYRVSGQDLNQG